jgi:hypothetical protein
MTLIADGEGVEGSVGDVAQALDDVTRPCRPLVRNTCHEPPEQKHDEADKGQQKTRNGMAGSVGVVAWDLRGWIGEGPLREKMKPCHHHGA